MSRFISNWNKATVFLRFLMICCHALELEKDQHKDPTLSKALTCLCNDNNQCVMNSLPLNVSIRSNTLSPAGPMGFCITSSEGRCYTAKDVNIGSAIKPLRSRRFVGSSEKAKGFGEVKEDLFSEFAGDYKVNRIDVDKFIRTRYGCLPSDQKSTFACNGHLVKHLVPKTIACCNSSDFCNANLTPEFFHHSSNEEAIRTALTNQKLFRKSKIHKKKHLDLGLNAGPQLLNGGTILNTSTVISVNSDGTLQPAGTRLFYFILIISFSTVAVILVSTLTVICVLYKCRKQPKTFHAIMLHKKPKKTSSTYAIKTHPDEEKRVLAELKICRKPTKCTQQTLGSGTTYQTLSTNSTQNADSIAEIQHLKGCSTVRLHQQTVSSQITLQKLIGSGRFSDVWLASWQGEAVLAKIFIPDNRLAQSLWRRTVCLHRSMLLRHHTIQGLMAVDWIEEYPEPNQMRSVSHLPHALIDSISPRAMLIGELHPWGSLQDLMATYRWYSCRTYPKQNSADDVSPLPDAVTRVFTLQRTTGERLLPPALTTTDELMLKILLRMALSITQGVCFLHSEFAGTRGKPALAHRNLKPSNVFVRSDWTCCIGDIGFAVRPPPCPLPVPLTELHSIYKQCVDQLDRSVRPDEVAGGQLGVGPKQIAASSERNGSIAGAQDTSTVLEKNAEGNQNTTNPSVTKAELLDWWPVGGLCAGTLRYLAPELLAQAIDPFCFEAHQRADIYSLALILWELLAWALPQTFSLRHQPCEQCHGSDSSRSSARSTSLCQPDGLLDRQACPQHCLIHVAYEVEIQAYIQSFGAPNWSNAGNHSIGRDSNRLVELSKPTTANEPDFQTMYHLVCDAQIRPQLPQVQCGPWTNLLVSNRSNSSWTSIEPTLHHGRCTETVVTTHSMKHIDSTSHSSTSSGASSLRGTHSGAHSSSTDHPRPEVSSAELTQMMCLVAQQWANLLPECWSANPDARLTAQRIRKVLQKLADQIDLFRMSRSETPSGTTVSLLRHHAKKSVTTPPRSSSTTIQEAQSS